MPEKRKLPKPSNPKNELQGRYENNTNELEGCAVALGKRAESSQCDRT